MLGYRARIGYTAPLSAIEVFPYEFYKIVPEGVTLVVSTAPAGVPEWEESNFPISEASAREMGDLGVNVIIVGGANARFGFERLEKQAKELTEKYSIPVTNTREAQIHAMRELGAKRILLAMAFNPAGRETYERFANDGFEVIGVAGAGYTIPQLGLVPVDAPAQVARRLAAEHPEADTIFIPAPHWPAASNVEMLEQETGMNVVTSTQSMVWEGLRLSKVTDSIQGFGRLLREH